jgi:hypothetical protein
MTHQDAYRCIEAVLGLSHAKQAVCVRLAAAASTPVFREWCSRRGVADQSRELLSCSDRWLAGSASGEELGRIADRFHRSLPQDLRLEAEPAGGYAGWALLGVAQIALDRCGDVHPDILHTAVCYAAAAACRSKTGPTEVAWNRLTAPELEFLERWWGRCCEQFPELTDAANAA